MSKRLREDGESGDETQEVKNVIPAVPPRGLPKDQPKRKLGICEQQARGFGIKPKVSDFGPADTALWPATPAEIYRARSKVNDRSEASSYMRWWFTAHEGMPVKPPEPPRSAFWMYTVEQKRVTFEKCGKWDQKKDTKRIGAAWKALAAEVMAGYVARFEEKCAEMEAQHDAYDETLAEWRKLKSAKLRDSGEPTNNEERRKLGTGLSDLCTCTFCKGGV